MKTKLVVDQSATEYCGFTCYREAIVQPYVIKSETIEDGYYIVEITGLNRFMRRGYDNVLAVFGHFHRDNGKLIYTASVWMDEDGNIDHPYDSEMLDDVDTLMSGNVEWYH